MKPSLYAHPFASYCQKVLIALYENDTPFTYRKIGPEDPNAMSELAELWPLKKFPVLLDEGHLWGKKEVAIQIRSVTGVDDGIQLNITKQEVEDLQPVDVEHPNR